MEEITDRAQWDDFVKKSGGHPLQLWGWGELKADDGNWTAHRFKTGDCGAQVLVRHLPRPFKSLAYIPRGPFGKNPERIFPEIVKWAKEKGNIELKIEPNLKKIGLEKPWRKSPGHIFINRTAALDLEKSEDELLKAMTKKTRQYIKKSTRDGVTVRPATSADLPKILALYHATAARDHFALHPDKYYEKLFEYMGENNAIFVAIAEKNIVAFLWNIETPTIAFELYGGVDELGQKWRANYILKWTAIKKAKADGVKVYDMNGLLNDGVSTFKLGFTGGEEILLAPTFDYPLSPLYGAWEKMLPLGKKIVHKFKR